MKGTKYILLLITCLCFLKVSENYVKYDTCKTHSIIESEKGTKCISSKLNASFSELDIDEEDIDDETKIYFEELASCSKLSFDTIIHQFAEFSQTHYSLVFFRRTVSLFILLLQILI